MSATTAGKAILATSGPYLLVVETEISDVRDLHFVGSLTPPTDFLRLLNDNISFCVGSDYLNVLISSTL